MVTIESMLKGRLGYAPTPMEPPPSETKDNVVQFSLTEGCNHNSCTYCTMYKDGRVVYSVKSEQEYYDHVRQVLAYLRRYPSALNQIDRIFIGAGNALSADFDTLFFASQYSLQAVLQATGRLPRRVAVYGNTKDILKQGEENLHMLYCGGTCGNCSIQRLGGRRGLEVVYWGLESGSDKVLKIAGKGYDSNEAYRAGKILDYSGIRASVMVMPGLGGITHSYDHEVDTANLLNYIRPEWITFMALTICNGTPYARWIEREEAGNRNRRLTPAEIAEQTARIIERLDFSTSIGVHGQDIHPTLDGNPVPIGVCQIEDRFDAQDVATQIRAGIQGLEDRRTRRFQIPFSFTPLRRSRS